MTVAQLMAVGCHAETIAQKLLPVLEETYTKYGIGTPVRQLCFLAQVSHESGGFFYTEELASGSAYEGRKDLGNIAPGDGVKYKGRGLIQVTGRNNYHAVGESLQQDFINNPTQLGGKNIDYCSPDQIRFATLSAGWFWNKTALNMLADHINIHAAIDEGTNLEAFREITRKINGGYNGLPDRLNKYKQGLKSFSDPNTINKTV
jgi:predicted chitinase